MHMMYYVNAIKKREDDYNKEVQNRLQKFSMFIV